MRQTINNIIQSKAPFMIALRYLLVTAVMFMGVARLRITLLVLVSPENYMQRDILQMYLMAKALISGFNPYLPLYELAAKFVGAFPFFPHPAPYPPFIALLFIPFTWLKINTMIFIWYGIEILCLAAISTLFSIILRGRVEIVEAIISFFILLALFPVMADLEVGQLSILLTLLLLAALLSMQKNHNVIAGVLIGISMAIKLITWPFIVYFVFKKDWRAAFSSSITVLGLNLIALLATGTKPFLDYYLHVSSQVMDVYHKFWANFSLFTVGYRLFEGTDSAIFATNYHTSPLINLPVLAPYISYGLVGAFLVFGLWAALRSSDTLTTFAILISVIVAASPIVWDHYFVMIIISLVVMARNLARLSFPPAQSVIYLLIVLLIFLFNERIGILMIMLNGGEDLLRANGNQINFASSLVSWLPIVEVVGLSILLWRSEERQELINEMVNVLPPDEALLSTSD